MVKQINGVEFGVHTKNGEIEKAAWAGFWLEMQNKMYGYNETLDAWHWFVAGWHAHIRGPR